MRAEHSRIYRELPDTRRSGESREPGYLVTSGDFIIIPTKHLENGGRSARTSGGVSSSVLDT